jgi:F-type H+-transporting ATPase subunit a
MLDISLKPEYVLKLGNLGITNSYLTTVLVTLILIILALYFYWHKTKSKNKLAKGINIAVYELLKLTDMVTGDREMSIKYFPVIATFLIFIFCANLLALLPGFLGSFFIMIDGHKTALLRSPNSDLTVTITLALYSVLATQIFSCQKLGMIGYVKRFFNFSSPIKAVTGFFELLSESIKLLSFSFRLFGNILAGEVLLLVPGFLVPYLVPLPIMILEVFVGVIQAFIFAILTL